MKLLYGLVFVASSLISSAYANAQSSHDLSLLVDEDGLSALAYRYEYMISAFPSVCDKNEGYDQGIAAACLKAKEFMTNELQAKTWDKAWFVTQSETSDHLRIYKVHKSMPLYNLGGYNYRCSVAYSLVVRKVSKELVVADNSVYCD